MAEMNQNKSRNNKQPLFLIYTNYEKKTNNLDRQKKFKKCML